MRVTKRTIQHKRLSDIIRIYPIGDSHVGARSCCEKPLAARVAEVEADPLGFWVGMGDYCEFINRRDPRFTPAALAQWITLEDLSDISAAQIERFNDIIEPIRTKCLAMVKGNHETSIQHHYETNAYYEIGRKIREAFVLQKKDPPRNIQLGYCGFLRLRLERGRAKTKGHFWTIDIFMHHGWGGGRLAGSKALKLERALRYYQADLVLIGHWHTMQTDAVDVITLNRAGRLKNQTRKGVVTGAWLEGHPEDSETYVEMAGYPPRPVGAPIIELLPATEEIRIIT